MAGAHDDHVTYSAKMDLVLEQLVAINACLDSHDACPAKLEQAWVSPFASTTGCLGTGNLGASEGGLGAGGGGRVEDDGVDGLQPDTPREEVEAAFYVEVAVPLLQPAFVLVEVQAWLDYGCAWICSPNLQQSAAMVAQPVEALLRDNPPRHSYQSSASWPSIFCTTDSHPLRRRSCGRRQPPWPPPRRCHLSYNTGGCHRPSPGAGSPLRHRSHVCRSIWPPTRPPSVDPTTDVVQFFSS
jgi:hypothetical protein